MRSLKISHVLLWGFSKFYEWFSLFYRGECVNKLTQNEFDFYAYIVFGCWSMWINNLLLSLNFTNSCKNVVHFEAFWWFLLDFEDVVYFDKTDVYCQTLCRKCGSDLFLFPYIQSTWRYFPRCFCQRAEEMIVLRKVRGRSLWKMKYLKETLRVEKEAIPLLLLLFSLK